MNRDRKIDYIEFVATNIEATKKFYGTVFGWKFGVMVPTMPVFKMDELPEDSKEKGQSRRDP